MRFWQHRDIDRLDQRSPRYVEALAELVERVLIPYHRAELRGAERIPRGPALYVGNHNSFYYAPEMYLLGYAAYRAHGLDAVPYGLAHEWAIDLPVINQLAVPMGAVRAGHRHGEELLRRGNKVVVYPGGDIDAARPFRHRNRIVFGGRRGYIRLALRAGVPIVPVVAAGAHATVVVLDDLRWLARLLGADRRLRIGVWPLTLLAPWGLWLGLPPPFLPLPSRILLEVMAPIHFERTGPRAAEDEAWVTACAERVEGAMQSTLDRLAAERTRR